VGLYGGSFDPAHEGHAHVAETALRRLRLDRVIWLISPGNPLKGAAESDLAERLAGARALARGRRMIVSDAERRLGERHTLMTVRRLKARFPAARFVLVIGADNLAGFHAWRGWTEILAEVPVAVVSRRVAGRRTQAAARFAPLARRFAHARLPQSAAARLVGSPPPAWVFLTARFHAQSSTSLRAAARKRANMC
jgi:nicotinate-nucleotide adenylyltransferase